MFACIRMITKHLHPAAEKPKQPVICPRPASTRYHAQRRHQNKHTRYTVQTNETGSMKLIRPKQGPTQSLATNAKPLALLVQRNVYSQGISAPWFSMRECSECRWTLLLTEGICTLPLAHETKHAKQTVMFRYQPPNMCQCVFRFRPGAIWVQILWDTL